MMGNSPPKDEAEYPVPDTWRQIFRDIAKAFAAGDFELSSHAIGGVAPINRDLTKIIAGNVEAYGDNLTLLSEKTWERSVCTWMGNHWHMLVDLSTMREPVSDLTLHAKFYEDRDPHVEITSVHVP